MTQKSAPTCTVAITYQAQPDQVENAVRALSDLIAVVVATEPDCFGIQLYQDDIEPARIFLFEQWTSREAYLGPHLQTPHLLAFKASSGPLFVGPPERDFWRLQAEFRAEGSAEERLTPGQVLERVRSLGAGSPAESAVFVREDRDTH